MSTLRQASALRSALRDCWDANSPQGFDPSSPIIRLHEPTFGPDEIWAALECLISTRVTMGEKVLEFERAFADAFGFAHAVMVNSGSSANLLAVAALCNHAIADRLKPGDEVIVPALSWSTTVWPLVQKGLVPVVVDIDPETLNIDPEQVEKAVGPRTRAIMPVHVYGNPCDMKALARIARERSLTLIEDCCESLGASFAGKPVGTFGRVAAFSFYYSHHITTLEGGMVATDDSEVAELLRILRAHGWVRETENPEKYHQRFPNIHPRFLFVNEGYNLRPTELQGAIGSVQLPKLNEFLAVRAENASAWRRDLEAFSDTFSFQSETSGGRSSWFGFPMVVRKNARRTREQVTEHLERRGIETRPIICGNIAEQPGLKAYPHRVVGDLANAAHVMRYGFTFGNHQAVGRTEREYVTRSVAECLAERVSR